MKTIFAILLSGLFIISSILLFTLKEWEKSDAESIKKATKTVFNHLGEKVIIDKDTLTIINIDTWNHDFILSNGLKLNSNFFINKKATE